MKKRLVLLCVVALIFGAVGTAAAYPVTFTDTTTFDSSGTNPNVDLVSYGGVYVDKLESSRDWVSWTHHFEFNPPAEEILSGRLSVWLKDDCDPWYAPFEFALGWAEDGQWALGEVNTGGYSYGVSAAFLKDGEFSVTLKSLCGDFYICRSDLTITYNSAPVPEPATLLLFGCGLVGLAGFGRNKFLKKSRKLPVSR